MSFIPGKLDSEEIIDKLLHVQYPLDFKLSKENALDVVDMFWRLDAYNSLISSETYLDYLISFINEKSKLPKNRKEFLEYLINSLGLGAEAVQKLSHVAMDMEVWQANEVNQKRFLQLFIEDEFPGDMIKGLYEKGIIEDRKESQESKEIKTGFYHHIIQEFLASKCFIRNGVVSYLDMFVVIKEKGVEAINPSWYGVIRFLLESAEWKQVLEWLLKFADEHEGTVNEYFTNTICSIDKNLLDSTSKKIIFELIYNHYQNKVVWIPVWSRKALANFCQPEHLEKFKTDIGTGNNKTEIIVKSGNIIGIISGLLKSKNELIKNDREYWKEKLVELANINDENGVLQRNSLDALEAFRDASLVSKVENSYQHKDHLVKEAFVEFCYQTDPEDPLVIKYLVQGVKDKLNYYPRRGLYKVESYRGISLVLDYLSTDIKFLNSFLDRENIYNDKGRKQDQVLIKHIEKNIDDSNITKLKKIVKLAFDEKRYYRFEKSYVLSEFARIIKLHNETYIFEILDNIDSVDKDKWLELYNFKSLFSWLIEEKDLSNVFLKLKSIAPDRAENIFESILYGVKFDREKLGEELIKVAIRKELIKDHSNDPAPEWERKQKSVYQEFLELLEPSPGKYSPLVFEFYNDHKKELEPDIVDHDKERLINALTIVLRGVDPTKIKVKIQGDRGESKTYTITEWTRYYIDAVKTFVSLGNKISHKLRKNLINFIPFAYSDDRSTIEELVKKINDKDLDFVNKVYLNKKDDIRYHLPDSYVEIIENYIGKGCKIRSAPMILKSFVNDKDIQFYTRRNALELLEKFINKKDTAGKDYLQNIFHSGYKSNVEDKKALAETANRILITKFKDEPAIEWRISKIKLKRKEMAGFVQEMEVHSVGDVENEINDKYFASPLIKLSDINFINKLIKLLDYSITVLKDKNSKPQAFVDYIWGIYYGYLENLKPQEGIKAIDITNQWINKNAKVDGINWFRYKVDQIRINYLLSFKKVTKRGV